MFSDIDWGNGPYYMKLYVDFDGQGNIFQMQQYGAQQLVSVPYALHAKVADDIAGGVGGSGGGTDDKILQAPTSMVQNFRVILRMELQQRLTWHLYRMVPMMPIIIQRTN